MIKPKKSTLNLIFLTDFIQSCSSSEAQIEPTLQISGQFSKYMKKEVTIVSDHSNEIKSFMDGDPVDCDILLFWDQNKTVFPKLYQLSLKIICVPATSAASERAFSSAGYIFSSRRANLNYRKLNDMAVVKSNFLNNKKETGNYLQNFNPI